MLKNKFIFYTSHNKRKEYFETFYAYFSGLFGIASVFLFNKKRFFQLFLYKYFRKFKRSYTNFLGCFNFVHQDILDAFFFSSIFLLFFRFFIRLLFFSNPFWYYNLFFFFLGFILQLNYNFLYFFRETYVKLLKILFGQNFWLQFNVYEKNIIYGVYSCDIPEKNITEKTKWNTFFQNLFIFFILIRLNILLYPLLFFFCNFFFTYFLLFNKFLLLSSFYSFFIIFSRLSLYCSDYTHKNFMRVVNYIEKFNPGENIAPTWKNSELIAIIVTRTFNNRKQKIDYEYLSPIAFNIYNRYKQINKNFYVYSDHVYSFIRYSARVAWNQDYLNGDIGKPYFVLLTKAQGLTILKNSLFCNPLGFGLIWFQNSDRSNFTKHIFPHINNLSKNHPQIFSLYSYLQKHFILRSNQTTLNENTDRAFLSPMPILDIKGKFTGYGQMRSVTAHAISNVDFEIQKKDVLKKLKSGELIETNFAKSFIPNLWTSEKNNEIICEPGLSEIFNKLHSRSNFAFPDVFNCISSFLDPLASKEQVIEAFFTCINFAELIISKKQISKQQLEEWLEIYPKLKKGLNSLFKLDESLFSQTKSEFVTEKIQVLKLINKNIAESEKPPFKSIVNTLDILYPGVPQEQHIQNFHLISEEWGGKKKSTHKSLMMEQHKNDSFFVYEKPSLKIKGSIESDD